MWTLCCGIPLIFWETISEVSDWLRESFPAARWTEQINIFYSVNSKLFRLSLANKVCHRHRVKALNFHAQPNGTSRVKIVERIYLESTNLLVLWFFLFISMRKTLLWFAISIKMFPIQFNLS